VWNIFHTFKAKKGYKFSGSCVVCGYTSGNEEQHGHSCTGKIIRDSWTNITAHCYECGLGYTVSYVPVYVKARQ
jgi:hypothetical protein